MQFVGIADDAIVLDDCNNVTVTANDFSGDVGGVYALRSTNVTVTWNRFQNIGDGTIGSGHSNYVQFNNVTGGLIDHNKGIGGNTEDMVSVYQSNSITVNNNQFEGTNWTSGSGSGIALGDGGGNNNTASNNILINPGQVGIFIAGGTGNSILNNTIYGAQRPKSNVGIYVWNQSSAACSNATVNGNQVSWYNAAGAPNPFWDGENCGSVTGTNQWDAVLDPLALAVAL